MAESDINIDDRFVISLSRGDDGVELEFITKESAAMGLVNLGTLLKLVSWEELIATSKTAHRMINKERSG